MVHHTVHKDWKISYSIFYKQTRLAFPMTTKKKTRKGLNIPWEFLTWLKSHEVNQHRRLPSKARREKQANQHAETGRVPVTLPSCLTNICLTRSLLNNPLVSTPFRNINIQLGKGDFLMWGLGHRRFRRWIIAWTATMWRPRKTYRLQMSLIKTQNNFC